MDDGKNERKVFLSRLNNNHLIIALLLLAAMAFLPCLKNGFINLDDNSYIIENPAIRSFSVENIKSWFTTFHKGNYYPLILLTYALEYRINGADPRVFHAFSIAFHLVNVLLAFGLFRRLTGNRELSFVAVLLWAVHPLRVESIAWAAEQKDLLYVLFVLLSLVFYAGYKQGEKIRNYWLSLLSFVLACFSKGMAVALVPLLFAADYFLDAKSDRKSWSGKIPYVILALIFGFIATKAQQESLYIQTNRTLFENLLVAGYGFLFYIIRFVLPVKLSAFHPYPGLPLPWPFYLSSLLSITAMVAAVIWLRKKKTLLFGLLFYALSIVFVLQIVPVGGFVAAERYSYLSTLGLSLVAAWSLMKLVKHSSLSLKTTGISIMAFLIMTGVAFSARRCQVWENSFTVWSDAIEKYPDTNDFAYNQRGNAFDLSGRLQKALEDFSRAVQINSKYFDAYYNRGCIYYKLGQFNQAIEDCNRAIALSPLFAKAYNIRGMAYGGQKNYEQALSDISKAIEFAPADPVFYYNRATTLGQVKNYLRAIEDFSRAVQLDPRYAQAYFYRGYTYYLMGDRRKANQDVQKARSLGYNQ
jgi:Flp pilus assembly protein TadD